MITILCIVMFTHMHTRFGYLNFFETIGVKSPSATAQLELFAVIVFY